MARMLAPLDLRDGMKVLEIGTGYNAGLLVHRTGNERHHLRVDLGTSWWEDGVEPMRRQRLRNVANDRLGPPRGGGGRCRGCAATALDGTFDNWRCGSLRMPGIFMTTSDSEQNLAESLLAGRCVRSDPADVRSVTYGRSGPNRALPSRRRT
jgi:hypothetical protein